jgi:excisionase family DNA binding protein
LSETAAALNISQMTVLRMIRNGVLPAQQLCKGAPWVVNAAALESAAVRDQAQSRRRRKPLPENPDRQALIFQ